jgi:hypothetical protein
MTRMTSGLLAFTGFEGETAMRNQNTHFEQVPLEVVKKIVEQQASAARTLELSRTRKEKKFQEIPLVVRTVNE